MTKGQLHVEARKHGVDEAVIQEWSDGDMTNDEFIECIIDWQQQPPGMDPDSLSASELKTELKSRGLSVRGNKPVLVGRLKIALGGMSKAEAPPNKVTAPNAPWIVSRTFTIVIAAVRTRTHSRVQEDTTLPWLKIANSAASPGSFSEQLNAALLEAHRNLSATKKTCHEDKLRRARTHGGPRPIIIDDS